MTDSLVELCMGLLIAPCCKWQTQVYKLLRCCAKVQADGLLLTADGKPGPPQWGVRGGGGRNRGLGGRFKGLDPVVPVTDPDILSSISEFYGIAQDFPLWGQIITRYIIYLLLAFAPCMVVCS